jgi:hypothetical protein
VKVTFRDSVEEESIASGVEEEEDGEEDPSHTNQHMKQRHLSSFFLLFLVSPKEPDEVRDY